MKICPKCGNEVGNYERFCTKCGSSLYIECPKCGTRLDKSAEFCSNCGAKCKRDYEPLSDSLPDSLPEKIFSVAAEMLFTLFLLDD